MHTDQYISYLISNLALSGANQYFLVIITLILINTYQHDDQYLVNYDKFSVKKNIFIIFETHILN